MNLPRSAGNVPRAAAVVDPDWIEFDSMINMRPSAGNRSRSVEDPAMRDRIVVIVERSVVS